MNKLQIEEIMKRNLKACKSDSNYNVITHLAWMCKPKKGRPSSWLNDQSYNIETAQIIDDNQREI